jgi:hypothetical protein
MVPELTAVTAEEAQCTVQALSELFRVKYCVRHSRGMSRQGPFPCQLPLPEWLWQRVLIGEGPCMHVRVTG